MTARFIMTAVTYVVCGMAPALVAHYVFRARFIGGVWAATAVGMIAAFAGGLIDVFLLTALPDLIPVGRIVDAGPPLIVAIAITVLFALISHSNESSH